MGKISKANLAWRRKQRKGAIMSPKTFEGIKEGEMKRGLSEERAGKAAGAEYWRQEKKKYRERKKK